MSSKYKHPGNSLTFVAPSGGVVSGGFYVIGGIGLVAETTAAETVEFQGIVTGVHALTKVGSQAWAVGDKVHWDAGNSRFTKTSTDGALMGVAASVVGSGAGETTGNVRLNGVAPNLAEGPQGAIVALTDSTGGSGSHDDTLADGLTATAPAAITEYTAHAAGGVAVTSNAATDLDTTAAALDTLVDEVQALQVTVAACVTDLAVQNQNDSDLAQKILEIRTALIAAGIIVA